MSPKLLPVHERFYTFQGEGMHMGAAAFFIRLFGCPLHCPWCDSAGTWHKDYVPKHISRMSPEELLLEAQAAGARRVVITGGEPCIHDLHPLVSLLRENGIATHLETSGAFEIRGQFDWITVSPKTAQMPLAENIVAASELKLIVDTTEAIHFWVHHIERLRQEHMGRTTTEENERRRAREHVHVHRAYLPTECTPIWLHPEWSLSKNSAILTVITQAVKVRGDPFRAGWQLHKLYRADTLDNRSAPSVPLGGNPALGY